MKYIKRSFGIIFLCAVISILACVTINIYFPAEQVESVAGEIVDDIRGRESTGDQESMLKTIRLVLSSNIAWAQDVTDVSNPTIRALKEQMKERYSQMKSYYDKGMLKEGDDGYVAVEDNSSLNLKEKRDLNNLVNAENKDREILYAEVAKALKIDGSQISKVAEIFAKEWQK